MANNHKHLSVSKKLMHVKPWYFLLIALLSFAVAVLALRSNNEHMITLRSAVYAADKDSTDVQAALKSLQAYVTQHMNTNLSAGRNAVHPPIQLKYTYDRLVQAQSDQIAKANAQLYSDAQHYCEQQNPTDFSGRNRVPCIEKYVQSHDTTVHNIPDALYKFDFVSPRWSPDLAGWSLVIAALSTLAFFFSLVASRWPAHKQPSS